MTGIPGLPPFEVIAAALRTTTESLAQELAGSADRAPDWNPFEWDVARAVAAIQGVGPLLAHRLAWRGPDPWREFLTGQIEHGVRRAVLIDALLLRLEEVTRRAGLAVIGLKGAALIRKQLYAPGERPMGDVDLLANTNDLPALARGIESLGYFHQFTSARHAVFANAGFSMPCGLGEHAAHPLKIEVHTRIADRLPATMVDITAQMRCADTRPGLNPYPDDSRLLLHLLLHAAGNMRAHCLRLIQLEDIARLTRAWESSRWEHFLTTTVNDGNAWWTLPPLLLAQRYCGATPPAGVIHTLNDAAPRRLRRAAQRYTLTEVSWSNLRIDAFPGIEWSRTPLEALRFARSRIAPKEEALADLHQGVKTMPALGAVPWYGLRHSSRIMRWLFTRPPRVQTLCSVLSALEGGTQARPHARS